MDDISQDFHNYSANNNLIVMAAAVCIGIATKDIIEKFMNDVILPLITFGSKASIPYNIYHYLLKIFDNRPIAKTIITGAGTTIWLFVVWSVIIFISFVFFKKLLDKNLIAQQLKAIKKARTVIDEQIKYYSSP